MPEHDLAKIDTTRTDFINQLYGQGDSSGRSGARHAYEHHHDRDTALALLPATGWKPARWSVVSVDSTTRAMARPARRLAADDAAGNARQRTVCVTLSGNYGHVTIPRHLRDIVITEYGVAGPARSGVMLRVKRPLAIADSRFQWDELVREAKAHAVLEVLPRCRIATVTTAAGAEGKLHPGRRLACCLIFRSVPI